MAMITCSECGTSISDQAENCPHCGSPQRGASSAVERDATRSASPGSSPPASGRHRIVDRVKLLVVALLLTPLIGWGVVTMINADWGGRDAKRQVVTVQNTMVRLVRQLESSTSEGAELRTAIAQFHDRLMAIDATGCPEDYRAQYRAVVTAAGRFRRAVEQYPGDEWDWLDHFIEQLVAGGQDLRAQGLAGEMAAAAEDVHLQLRELDAVAKRYIELVGP